MRAVFTGGSGGGASTISQQVVKNLYGRRGGGVPGLLVDKICEVIIARRLESVYTKEEVLLLYLNSVPFGENAYGVEAAARRYFGRAAHRLRFEEAAVLVGLLKANTAYNPRLHPEASRRRRNEVLALMGAQGFLPSDAMDSLRALPLVLDHQGATAYDAYGYFVDQVHRRALDIIEAYNARTGAHFDIQKDGLRIETTLDTTL
jgi:penicillin-binding protein 1A